MLLIIEMASFDTEMFALSPRLELMKSVQIKSEILS